MKTTVKSTPATGDSGPISRRSLFAALAALFIGYKSGKDKQRNEDGEEISKLENNFFDMLYKVYEDQLTAFAYQVNIMLDFRKNIPDQVTFQDYMAHYQTISNSLIVAQKLRLDLAKILPSTPPDEILGVLDREKKYEVIESEILTPLLKLALKEGAGGIVKRILTSYPEFADTIKDEMHVYEESPRKDCALIGGVFKEITPDELRKFVAERQNCKQPLQGTWQEIVGKTTGAPSSGIGQ